MALVPVVPVPPSMDYLAVHTDGALLWITWQRAQAGSEQQQQPGPGPGTTMSEETTLHDNNSNDNSLVQVLFDAFPR